MRIWTYQELRLKVERDLDLEEELFITPAEMLGYANEAIDEAEAEIIKINEDYLLTCAPISFVAGRAVYAMPANIYANKARGIEYLNGSIYYPIRRIRNYHMFDRIQDAMYQPSSTQDYQWYPRNDSAEGGQKMVFIPTPQETPGTTFAVTVANPAVFTKVAHGLTSGAEIYLSTNGSLPTGLKAGRIYTVTTVIDADTFRVSEVPGGADIATSGTQSGTHSYEQFPFRATLWFIRQANRLYLDADICDIPQFANFITQFMKKRCYEKEPGHPTFQQAIVDLDRQRKLMVETLTEMVPDDDNRVQGDFSHYWEHS